MWAHKALCIWWCHADEKGTEVPRDLERSFLFQSSIFSNCGRKTSIGITWELNRNADSQVPPQTHQIRNSGGKPAICVLTRPPGDSEAHSGLGATALERQSGRWGVKRKERRGRKWGGDDSEGRTTRRLLGGRLKWLTKYKYGLLKSSLHRWSLSQDSWFSCKDSKTSGLGQQWGGGQVKPSHLMKQMLGGRGGYGNRSFRDIRAILEMALNSMSLESINSIYKSVGYKVPCGP